MIIFKWQGWGGVRVPSLVYTLPGHTSAGEGAGRGGEHFEGERSLVSCLSPPLPVPPALCSLLEGGGGLFTR